jgi:hypothetical protein
LMGEGQGEGEIQYRSIIQPINKKAALCGRPPCNQRQTHSVSRVCSRKCEGERLSHHQS